MGDSDKTQLIEELEVERRQQHALLDSTSYAIITTDLDSVIQSWDRAAEALYGWSTEEAIGQRMDELVPTEYDDQNGNDGRAKLRAEGTWSGEVIHTRKDGRQIVVQVSTNLVKGDAGHPTHVVSINRGITGRRRAEEASLRSEENLRAILNASPDGICLLDINGIILSANETYARRLGLEPDNVVGKSALQHAPHESMREREAAIEKVFRTGEPSQYEHGELSGVFESHLHPVLGPAGEVTAVAVYARDITARRRAEESARETEIRARTMMQQCPLPILVMSTDGRMVEVNDAYLELWDIPEEALPELFNKYDIFQDEQARRLGVMPYIERGFAGESVLLPPLEYDAADAAQTLEISDAKGRKRWILSRIYPLIDERGQIQNVVMQHEDITERMRVEKTLRLKNLVFDAAITANCIADARGIITEANQAFLDAGGHSGRDEVVGKPISHFLRHEEDAEEMLSVLKTTGKWTGDFDARRKDGSTFVTHLLATVLRDAGGEVVGYQSSAIDITEKRNLQTSLAQSDRLASMGMLAAGVAHEINNPLSYVLYNLETLTEDLPRLFKRIQSTEAREDAVDADGTAATPDDGAEPISPGMLEDLAECAREGADGARRIKDIVLGLSTFSRVEQDELTPVSLHGAIEHAINICSHEIKYRARLVKDFGRVPTVLASEGPLAQVVLNLLVNASHAIDEGDAEHNEIRIRTWSEGEDAFFEVRDTGRGIPPEDLERLFEPFFTTKPVSAGSGLGLSICKNIISGYGGDIAVNSKVAEGACFTVRLPLSPEETGQVETRGAAQPEAAPVERGRVLVIDDEASIRSLLRRLLGPHHEVVTAESGAAAKELLERDRSFDLIICDVMMPAVSGMDLHKWLVDTDPDLAKSLIFITGGAFTPKAREYLARLDNLQVEKPFETKNFQCTVSKLISAARSKNVQSA
jgi:PAS domain S-box-containing protein